MDNVPNLNYIIVEQMKTDSPLCLSFGEAQKEEFALLTLVGLFCNECKKAKTDDTGCYILVLLSVYTFTYSALAFYF